jgi:tight adherence protein B
MSAEQVIFVGMVFLAVFLLARALIVPTFGTEAEAAKRLRGRINNVLDSLDSSTASLLREKYLRDLSPLERWIEGLPGMDWLARVIEQAGKKIPAYRLVLIAAILAAFSGLIVGLMTHQTLFGLLAFIVVLPLPILKIRVERDRRLARFEEQLPEALDVMTRALRAGHPFTETLKMVGDEMTEPIAGEFRITFSDINYGMSVKAAFMSLLQRIPSLSLMTMVTAVLIQRETGGNIAEILDKISAVVRGRFRFQRKIRTLSAEGRMSAWVLTLMPFLLAVALSLTSPDYLPMLVKDPAGRKLIVGAFVMITIGTYWMRKIIRIRV